MTGRRRKAATKKGSSKVSKMSIVEPDESHEAASEEQKPQTVEEAEAAETSEVGEDSGNGKPKGRKYHPQENAFNYNMDDDEADTYEILDLRYRNAAQGAVMAQLKISNLQLQIERITHQYKEQVRKLQGDISEANVGKKKQDDAVSRYSKEMIAYREKLCEKYDIEGGEGELVVDLDHRIIRQRIRDPETGKEIVA